MFSGSAAAAPAPCTPPLGHLPPLVLLLLVVMEHPWVCRAEGAGKDTWVSLFGAVRIGGSLSGLKALQHHAFSRSLLLGSSQS